MCSGINQSENSSDQSEYYLFRGDQYWRLTDVAIAEGYPRSISSGWGGALPSNLDAAFTWNRKGATYLFQNGQYWKYFNQDPAPGYPKSIDEGFPGIPNDIDTVFVWGGNDKIYFTKVEKYWKFDPERKPHVRKGRYPRPIKSWGLPSNLDAALQWINGRTYFFKSGHYWRFEDRSFTLSKASPSYPRSTGPWWFGCS